MSSSLLPLTLFGSHDGERLGGVCVALVTNNQDPQGLGRVKVKFPWLGEDDESDWIRIVSPMAGKGRGAYFLPEVDDEVLVAFEHGAADKGFVLGCLWNGTDKPPESNGDGANNNRTIKSRSGHIIRLNDKNGDEQIEIVDKSGQNQVVIKTSDNSISITAAGDVTVKAGGKLKLSGSSVEVHSDAETKVIAGANAEISAGGQLNAKGSVINLN
jgi:phage baseplate assembly protein V